MKKLDNTEKIWERNMKDVSPSIRERSWSGVLLYAKQDTLNLAE